MEVTLDLAALVSALAWPAVIGFVVWRYREPLSEFLREAPRRVRSISAAGVSIELAETEPRALLSLQDVKVDLRRAGTSGDVNDSTLRSFYAQIEDPSRIDHAVVDLGYGSDWLSSRLFILSVVLRRMRGLQAFVFVESVENSRRHFLGVCDSRQLRWRLASRWPRYESGLAAAELHVWGHPYDDVSGLLIPWKQLPGGQQMEIPAFREWADIADAEGRIVTRDWPNPEPAAQLLRSFLDAVQRPAVPAPPSSGWQVLPSDAGVAEYSEWLTGALVDDVLRESLDKRSIPLHAWQGWTDEIRARAVLEHESRWVAVTRDEGVFDHLIDRAQILEQLGRHARSAN
jgi:hypothetical protein